MNGKAKSMKYRRIFFDELRRQSVKLKDYRAGLKEETRKTEDERLYKTVDLIEHLGHLVRTDGILSMEEAAYSFSDDEKGEYLDDMVMWVVDGTEPAIVQELCLTRFFAGDYDAVEGMKFLISMAGILKIQEGFNPLVIRSMMLNMLPKDMRCEFRRRKAEELDKEKRYIPGDEEESDFQMSDVEYLCAEGIPVDESHEGYYLLKLMDESIHLLDDRSIQRFLRELTHDEIVEMMIGVGGEARKTLFCNMSRRLAAAVADDIRSYMAFDPDMTVMSVKRSYDKLLNLMNNMEIYSAEEGLIKEFYGVLAGEMKEEEEKKKKHRDNMRRLRKLLDSYAG